MIILGKHPAFMSSVQRMVINTDLESTPGPGNYAQYSSIHHPLIFPRGSDSDSYIMYDGGSMFLT